MLNIIFVDDDIPLLSGLRRMLRPQRHEWKMHFCSSGQDALAIMAKEHIDVIVSDMRMPGMDGAELLNRVMNEYPNVVRIALSGQSSQEMVMKSVRTVHQYLSKPCDPETLKETINSACGIQNIVIDDGLKQLISQIDSLPSLPNMYAQIVEELKSEDTSIISVANIISKDVGMTAQILKLVNSAFFGFFHHIEDPKKAVSLLGLETIKSLVLSIEIFTIFEGTEQSSAAIRSTWEHSMRVATLAKKLAQFENLDNDSCNIAFMSGFLHDIGILIVASKMKEKFRQILTVSEDSNKSIIEIETEILGTTHADVGAYLLQLWGLSDDIVNCIARHHNPSESEDTEFSVLSAVYIANYLDRIIQLKEEHTFDPEYLQRIGKADRVDDWRNMAEEFLAEGLTA